MNVLRQDGLGQGFGKSGFSDKGPGLKGKMFASIAWRKGKRIDVVRSVFRQDGFLPVRWQLGWLHARAIWRTE